jgi:hypothetical protein
VTTSLPPLPYANEPRRTKDGRLMPPNAGKGRPPGVPNKTNQALKEAILLAAEEVGNEIAEEAEERGESRPGGLAGYLTMVARNDVKSFCVLLGKVLPLQISGADGNALEVTFRTVYETKLGTP